MDATAVSLVLLWIAVVVNAVLLAALLSRVRTLHGGAALTGTGIPHPALDLVGNPIPRFIETAVSGRTVSPVPGPGGTAVLAFFSAACSSCVAHLGPFRRLAAAAEEAGVAVIAVIDGEERNSRHLLDGITSSVEVLLAPIGSNHLVFDCGVSSLPSYLAVDDTGVVIAAGGTPPELSEGLGLGRSSRARSRKVRSHT